MKRPWHGLGVDDLCFFFKCFSNQISVSIFFLFLRIVALIGQRFFEVNNFFSFYKYISL